MKGVYLLVAFMFYYVGSVKAQFDITLSGDYLSPIVKLNKYEAKSTNAASRTTSKQEFYSSGGGLMFNAELLYSIKHNWKLGVDLSYWSGSSNSSKDIISPINVESTHIKFSQIRITPQIQYYDTGRNFFLGIGLIVPIRNNGYEHFYERDYQNILFSQTIWEIKNQFRLGQSIRAGYRYRITKSIYATIQLKANFLLAKPKSASIVDYTDLYDRTINERYKNEMDRNRIYLGEIREIDILKRKDATLMSSEVYSLSSIGIGFGIAYSFN